MFSGITTCISNLGLLWGAVGGGWLAWQTMAGDDICEWRPAYLRLTCYQSQLTPPSSQTLSVSVSLSHPLTLGLIHVNLIQLKVYFLLAVRNFRFTLNFFLLTLCLYFVLEGNKNVWPKIGVFYQTIFYVSI